MSVINHVLNVTCDYHLQHAQLTQFLDITPNRVAVCPIVNAATAEEAILPDRAARVEVAGTSGLRFEVQPLSGQKDTCSVSTRHQGQYCACHCGRQWRG